MNQKGFIPIILIVIGAVALASVTFGVIKYRDEVTATVLEMFMGSKVEISDIDLTEEIPQLSDESEGQGEMIEEAELVEESIVEEPVLELAEVIEVVRPPEPEEVVEEETIVEEEVIEEITEEEVIEEEITEEEEVIEPEPEPEESQQPSRPYGRYIMTGTPNPSITPSSPVIISHENNQLLNEEDYADFELEGTADSDVTILIQVGDVIYEAVVKEDGIWEQKDIILKEGENVLSLKAENNAGNKSEALILTLYLDSQIPVTIIGTNYDPENPSYEFTVSWSSFESDCIFDVKYLDDEEDWDLEGTSSTSKDFTASEEGTYKFQAMATDLAGNIGEWSEVVEVSIEPEEDTTPPEITLNGEATVYLSVGDDYDDDGATAFDYVDGDLIEITESIKVDGLDDVDTATAGTYTIKYNVSDAAGNEADEVTRTVNVSE